MLSKRCNRLVVVAMAVPLAAIGCKDSDEAGGDERSGDEGDAPSLRPRSNPMEYVGITVTKPLASVEEFEAVASPLFGAQAAAGALHTDLELQPGLLLTVEEDTRTPDQVVVRLDMVTVAEPKDERRTIYRAPVSLQYGEVTVETVKAAMRTTKQVVEVEEDTMDPWWLEYRSNSAQGGRLILRVEWDGVGATTLSVTTETPRTSLTPGKVGTAAYGGKPFETIAGTVWFELSRDQFDFFSHRAYGVTAGKDQNFTDFVLQPHRWLHLTVTPRLEDKIIDVGFEVVTADDRRIPLANAPASLVAGEQFQQNVFRLVDNMKARERATPGSSTPFKTPFYYEDRDGGGVVVVIAQGEGGVFKIAYFVESPTNFLEEVEFLEYTHVVEIPEVDPTPSTCEELGSEEAIAGKFHVTFAASDTVTGSDDLTHPLKGKVWGSVFRAEDVTVGGPKDGKEAVADFHFPEVDLTQDPQPVYVIETDVPIGEYQILGFMDIDGNAGDESHPDQGDPVMIPIGAYDLKCAAQPVVAEFALLHP